jgi:hypothetical protein
MGLASLSSKYRRYHETKANEGFMCCAGLSKIEKIPVAFQFISTHAGKFNWQTAAASKVTRFLTRN